MSVLHALLTLGCAVYWVDVKDPMAQLEKEENFLSDLTNVYLNNI